MDDLKALPEFEELLLEVSLIWGESNIFQAANWLMNSKFDEDRVIISLVVRRAAIQHPKDCLKWIFTSIAPEERELLIENAVFSAIGSHKNALSDFSRRLVGRKADMLNGVIAVALAESNDVSYKTVLDKIVSKKMKAQYLERSILALSKVNPKESISSLSMEDFALLSSKKEILKNWAKLAPIEVYEWLLSESPNELCSAVLAEALPDPLSEFKKNKYLTEELLALFPRRLPAIVPGRWRADSSRYTVASKAYNSYRADIIEVAQQCAKEWGEQDFMGAQESFEDTESTFNDYFYLGLLSTSKAENQVAAFAVPKKIKDSRLQRQAVHYLLIAFVESSPMEIVELVEEYDLMNFTTASHLMSIWAKQDIDSAEKWLISQLSQTWFSSTAAVHGASLASQSPDKLKKFIRKLPKSSHENFQENLESYLAQTNPELLKLIHAKIAH